MVDEMTSILMSDPVLSRFRTVLDRIYGDRIARMVLFGSHARGDARPDSDWDIAVFLKEPMETEAEACRLADAGIDILVDTGAVINSVRLPAARWTDRTGFMAELRRDGIAL